VLINTSDNGGFTVDAGTCIDPKLQTFSLSNVWCGDTPGIGNYGAYGNSAVRTSRQWSSSTRPAVWLACTPVPVSDDRLHVYNPGVTTEALNSVTIALATDPANGEIEAVPGDTSTDVAGCYASWFSTTPQTWSGGSIASGQTVDGSGTVSMPASTSTRTLPRRNPRPRVLGELTTRAGASLPPAQQGRRAGRGALFPRPGHPANTVRCPAVWPGRRQGSSQYVFLTPAIGLSST